jgi:hypothetical protein
MCFCVCLLLESSRFLDHVVLTVADVRITVAIRVPFRHALIVDRRRIAFRVDNLTKLVVLLKPRVKQHIFAGDSLVGIAAQKCADNAAGL